MISEREATEFMVEARRYLSVRPGRYPSQLTIDEILSEAFKIIQDRPSYDPAIAPWEPYVAQRVKWAVTNLLKGFWNRAKREVNLDDTLIKTRRSTIQPSLFEEYETNFTAREREVLIAILSGRNLTDIADDLFINVATLHKHINSIYKKIDHTFPNFEHNLHSLLLWGIRSGFYSMDDVFKTG